MTKKHMQDFDNDRSLPYFTFQNLTEAIFWNNSDGTIMYVNDTACKMSGYSREELATMKVGNINTSELTADLSIFRKKLKAAKQLTFETKFIHKQG